MQLQVEEAVKDERLARLQALLNRTGAGLQCGDRRPQADVLFSREGKRAGQALGYSPYMQSVHVDERRAPRPTAWPKSRSSAPP